ncbi:MAG: pyridoxal phosphate-dependent aminotransferase family protein [Planctomycetaceae bacterium]|nr:pyridoxal phosphate-dependent aminotransferase family protein [Planctomycetaceae bacterium]
MVFFHKFPSSNQHRDAGTTGQQMGRSSSGMSGTNTGSSQLSLEGPPDALVMIANRSYHYYAGNAYLGLQSHPGVLAATCEATLRYGTGTGTTRFALTAPPVLQVEQLAAQYLCFNRAFYHGSDYLGPQFLLETLDETVDRIFVDEAADKGIFQAVKSRQTESQPIVFRHNDPDSLRLELRKHLKPSERPLVMTNGVFPMTGKIAPLDRFAMVLSPIDGASLLVDDSHGFGVLGPYGRGVYEHFGLDSGHINRTTQDTFAANFGDDFDDASPKEDWISGTNDIHSEIMNRLPVRYYHSAALTKAIGGSGGIIAGSELFVERLIERSTAFGNMAAPSSPLAAGTAEGMVMAFRANDLRQKLRENTHYLKKKLSGMGIATDSSDVPIIAMTLGTAGNMRRVQQRLSERSVFLAYIPRGPGLSNDGALRISIFATHTTEMLDHLVEQLERVL